MTAERSLGARPALAVLVSLLLATLAGCSASSSPSASSPQDGALPIVRTYAALGDSYTAAPYVPTTSLAGGCLRSTGNYPARLADRLGARLHDASCSGATTRDLVHRQTFGVGTLRASVPAQLRSVLPDTDLVTVGIGGNDEQLFGSLVGEHPGLDARSAAAAVAATRRTSRRVAAVLTRVRQKATGAVVVLVGYPRLVDPARGCAGMPSPADDRRRLAAVEAALNRALARAARTAGTGFLDLHPLSRGHEVCSDDPWVNGRITDERRAAAYHPFPEEQQAVADALLRLLSEADG